MKQLSMYNSCHNVHTITHPISITAAVQGHKSQTLSLYLASISISGYNGRKAKQYSKS